MGNKLPTINLLRKEATIVDRFIEWALTAGRLLVIITELVAFSAFVYRFTLDRQLVDLHDKMKQKQTIISLLKTNEATYRDLQNRLAFAATINNQGSDQTKLLSDVLADAPPDFIITKLSVSGKNLNLEATLQFITSLSGFLDKLKQDPRIDSVSLNNIADRTSSAIISVSISAALK